MTWQVEGRGSDFSSDIEDLLEALLSDNWADIGEFSFYEFDPTEFNVGPPSDVVFDNDWYADYNDYKVSVTSVTSSTDSDTLGSRGYEYDHDLNIHVWGRVPTANTKPPAMGIIKRAIEQIVAQNATALGQNIRYMELTTWTLDFPEDSARTTWHSVGKVTAYYRKTNV